MTLIDSGGAGQSRGPMPHSLQRSVFPNWSVVGCSTESISFEPIVSYSGCNPSRSRGLADLGTAAGVQREVQNDSGFASGPATELAKAFLDGGRLREEKSWKEEPADVDL